MWDGPDLNNHDIKEGKDESSVTIHKMSSPPTNSQDPNMPITTASQPGANLTRKKEDKSETR